MLSEYDFCITIEGDKRVVADGIKRIAFFSSDKISLLIGKRVYDIIGEKLSIREAQAGVVEVTGHIIGVTRV